MCSAAVDQHGVYRPEGSRLARLQAALGCPGWRGVAVRMTFLVSPDAFRV